MSEFGDGSVIGDLITGEMQTGSILGSGRLLYITRTFNKFKRERNPSADRNKVTETLTGNTRTVRQEPMCWDEAEFSVSTQPQEAYMISQYYEYWQLDISLANYYDWIGGWLYGTTAGGLGAIGSVGSAGQAEAAAAAAAELAGAEAAAASGAAGSGFLQGIRAGLSQSVTTVFAEGTAASTGATVAGLVAWGAGIFYIGTSLMRMADGGGWELIASGWQFMENDYVDVGDPTKSTVWKQTSPLRKCRPITQPGFSPGTEGTGGSEGGSNNNENPENEESHGSNPHHNSENEYAVVLGGLVSEAMIKYPAVGLVQGKDLPTYSLENKASSKESESMKYVVKKPKFGGKLRIENRYKKGSCC